MLHWLQLVSLANSAPATQQQAIATLVQKEVDAQLRGSGVDRSRTPRSGTIGHMRGRKNRRLQLTGPQQLALPSSASSAPAPKANPKSKGKGKGRGKRPGRRPLAGKVWTLADLLAGGDEVASMLHRNEGNVVCYRFQEGTCQLDPCTRSHVCIGCGGPRGYNQCKCLQSRLAALP